MALKHCYDIKANNSAQLDTFGGIAKKSNLILRISYVFIHKFFSEIY